MDASTLGLEPISSTSLPFLLAEPRPASLTKRLDSARSINIGSHIKLHWIKRPTSHDKGGEQCDRDHGVYSSVTYPSPIGRRIDRTWVPCPFGENSLCRWNAILRDGADTSNHHIIIWCCVCKMWRAWILEAKGESNSDPTYHQPSCPL